MKYLSEIIDEGKYDPHQSTLDQYINYSNWLESQLQEAKKEIEDEQNEGFDKFREEVIKNRKLSKENKQLIEALKEWKNLSPHLRTIYSEGTGSEMKYANKLAELTRKKLNQLTEDTRIERGGERSRG